MPSTSSSVAAIHTAPRSGPSGTPTTPSLVAVIPSTHRPIPTACGYRSRPLYTSYPQAVYGLVRPRMRGVTTTMPATHRPHSICGTSCRTIDCLARFCLSLCTAAAPSTSPASGQVNRVVHTRSTVVHIVVLRLVHTRPEYGCAKFPLFGTAAHVQPAFDALSAPAYPGTAVPVTFHDRCQ